MSAMGASGAALTPAIDGSGQSLTNAPYWSHTGAFGPGDYTKSGGVVGGSELDAIFGQRTPELMGMVNRQNVPYDQQTLQHAFADARVFLMTLFRANFEVASGWQFDLAPREVAPQMNYSWVSVQVPKTMLDPQPEGTAPRLINYRAETHHGSLGRFGLGAREYHDFLQRPEGRQVWMMKLAGIASSTIVSAKIMVARAVTAAPSSYASNVTRAGITYDKMRDVYANEINTFGILADPIGIQVMDDTIRKVIEGTGIDTNYNMAVVPHGTKNYMAFHSRDNTDASKRGEAFATRVLSLGARAYDGVLDGVRVYTEKPWIVQNLSQDELKQLQRLTNICQWYHIYDSDREKLRADYDPTLAMSIAHRSMDIDQWKILKVGSAFYDATIRWAAAGSLHPHHKDLIDNLPAELQRSNVNVPDGNVDGYLWKDPTIPVMSADSSRAAFGEGYHEIEHWGDTSFAARSWESDKIHGQYFRMRCAKDGDGLSSEDQSALRAMDKLAKALYRKNDLDDESLGGYLFGVAANPKNHSAAGWDAHKSVYLDRGSNGAPQPPGVEKDLAARHHPFDSSKVFNPSEQGKSLANRGAMFVDGTDGDRWYVWKFEVDTSDTFRFGNRDPQFAGANGDPAGWDATTLRRDLAVPAAFLPDNTASIVVNPAAAGYARPKIVGYGSGYGYVLAPFDAFGPVSSDGRARQWNHAVPADSPFRSKEWKYLAAQSTAGWGADDAANIALFAGAVAGRAIPGSFLTTPQGFLAPKLVEAPIRPYGYGTYSGLKTLAQMYSDGNMRGWDRDAVGKVASDGMEAYDKVDEIDKLAHPMNSLRNPNYAPMYMRSGDADHDASAAVHSVAYKTLPEHPLWFRIPKSDFAAGFDKIKAGVLFEDGPAGIAAGAMRPSSSPVSALLVAMGLGVGPEGVGHPATIDGLDVVGTPNFAVLMRILKDVVESGAVDPAILEDLRDPDAARALFRKYKAGTLGRSYSDLYARETGEEGDRSSFAWFFVNEIAGIADPVERIGLFAGMLGLAKVTTRMREITRERLAALAKSVDSRKVGTRQKKKRVEFEADVEGDVAAARGKLGEGHTWINTCLAFSPEFWKRIDPAALDEDGLANLAKLPIRPTNPLNAGEPVFHTRLDRAEIWTDGLDAASQDAFRQGATAVQHARAHWEHRGGFGFFGKGGLAAAGMHTAPSGTNPWLESAPMAEFEGFDDDTEGAAAPAVVSSDIEGPFYTRQDYVGERAGRASRSVPKHFMLERFAKANKITGNRLERMGTINMLFSRVHKESLLAMLREKLSTPTSSYLAVQPFVQFLMDAAVWAEGGRNTARLFYNWSDLSFQYQAVTKKWFLHFTIWLDAAVFDSTKIAVWPDAKFAGYVSGMDDRLFNDPTAWDPKAIDFGLGSMFIFDLGGDTATPDFLRETADPFNLTGTINKRNIPGRIGDPLNAVIGARLSPFPGWIYGNWTWGFSDVNEGDTMDASSFAATKYSNYLNLLCFSGYCKKYDFVTGHHDIHVTGTGHLGKKWQPPLNPLFSGQIQIHLDGVNKE
jgi:hypothetical protein